MSVDYTVRIGPYILVHNPPKDGKEEYHTCVNNKCKNYKKAIADKFCSQCGVKIRLVSVPCQAPIDFDFYDEFNERLSPIMTQWKPKHLENYEILVSNEVSSSSVDFDPHQDFFEKELSQIDSSKEIADFLNKYEKEINRLREVIGADAVKTKWGVLSWAS